MLIRPRLILIAALAASLSGAPLEASRQKTGDQTTTSSQPTVKKKRTARIQRSAAARHAFARQTGYPKGRPGYVIDHIIPLACGGADAPANMQWQTIAEAKLKDKTERKGC